MVLFPPTLAHISHPIPISPHHTFSSSSHPIPFSTQTRKQEEEVRTPHQCPHARHQINQFALYARVASTAAPECGLRDRVAPSHYTSSASFFCSVEWGRGGVGRRVMVRGSGEGRAYRARGNDLPRGWLWRSLGVRKLFAVSDVRRGRKLSIQRQSEGCGEGGGKGEGNRGDDLL